MSSELIRQAGGVLHIGAHEGQESLLYGHLGVPVLWIEAMPDKFKILQTRIAEYPNQKSKCFLLGDVEGSLVSFYISSNNGASSSIFLPKEDSNLPFQMTNTIQLSMRRLDCVLDRTEISRYRHWVIDVQGAELLVLEGAGDLIEFCNSLVVEAKRESFYEGGTKWKELLHFLLERGFIPLWQVGQDDEDNAYFVRVEKRLPGIYYDE